ncbi:hypothetical protein LAUMK191_05446 [Mycobacterium attenuatum]|uniref:Lipoprotein LpqS n=1 Tax=Mycobacterium attenuatum TaxID=2341086 RepID=A0A498QH59_9MYCO|nr:hypothetical protein [Mycobacterium attenuatum]VBA44203.1 hypothetical protein LAUMK136_05490 [Mycobacterium attenuatum]VBA60290.1 hypothetical protein LAUMK191_05446 [Mycobacterium attenuatum]
MMRHARGVAWPALLLVGLIAAAPTLHVAAGDLARASAAPTPVSLTGSKAPVAAGPAPSGAVATGRLHLRYGDPVTVAESNSDSDVPAWPFAVGTIAVVGAGALWAVRRRP